MLALATGTFSVLRGTTANAWGDDGDAATVVASGVPMALQPAARGRTSRADGRLQEVDTFLGWAPHATDLVLEDRLLDETTGAVYVLAVVHRQPNTVMTPDVRIEARRVRAGS